MSEKESERPLQVGQWTLNQLLNEVKRIVQKRSKLRRSERQKVLTVFNFITKNELIKFQKEPEKKEEE